MRSRWAVTGSHASKLLHLLTFRASIRQYEIDEQQNWKICTIVCFVSSERNEQYIYKYMAKIPFFILIQALSTFCCWNNLGGIEKTLGPFCVTCAIQNVCVYFKMKPISFRCFRIKIFMWIFGMKEKRFTVAWWSHWVWLRYCANRFDTL